MITKFFYCSLNPFILTLDFNILHTLFTFFSGTDKENLVDNQELPKLEIISIILMTFSFDSWMIL